MENKRLSCIESSRKNIRKERGEKKKKLSRAVAILEKSKRFVFTDLAALKEFETNSANYIPKSIRLPFPIISLEVTEAGYDQVYAMTGAMIVMARQISENELKINVFIRFDGGLGWQYYFADLAIVLKDNGKMDMGYNNIINIDKSKLSEEDIKFNDYVSRMAIIEVLALIHFLENYPNHVEIKEPSSDKVPRKSGKLADADSYRILKLPTELLEKSESLGGTHNSPRAHERRGFWRRSKYGVRHWVNATVVNPENPNKIAKDYAIGL